MLRDESIWFRDQIPLLSETGVKRILNVGSSTFQYRNVIQPHMKENVFDPLRAADIQVVHLDIKDDPGVDIVGDLADPQFLSKLKALGFDAALVNNVLPHIRGNVRDVCQSIEDILRPEGFVFASSVLLFPTTPDPYDNHLRLKPNELAQYFPACSVVKSHVIEVDDSLARGLVRRGRFGIAVLARLFVPFYNFRSWLYLVRYLPNVFERYKVSCVVLKKS